MKKLLFFITLFLQSLPIHATIDCSAVHEYCAELQKSFNDCISRITKYPKRTPLPPRSMEQVQEKESLDRERTKSNVLHQHMAYNELQEQCVQLNHKVPYLKEENTEEYMSFREDSNSFSKEDEQMVKGVISDLHFGTIFRTTESLKSLEKQLRQINHKRAEELSDVQRSNHMIDELLVKQGGFGTCFFAIVLDGFKKL